ncbi:GntR family transcriptional regulator [Allorhodopirellula solitaria]|nr:GntR family transcriptional regulator [Allorhodopirellula solitaria]
MYHITNTLSQKGFQAMFFSIDSANGVPIYEQLIRQVKLAVADGVLSGGQMVPSVRHLANELAINPNTIQRAYQQLQADRVLEVVRGRGLAVRRDALDRCTKARNTLVANALERLLADALAGGMSAGELRTLFEQELQRQSQ